MAGEQAVVMEGGDDQVFQANFDQLPNEIMAMILSDAHSPLKQWDSATRRLVCKKWKSLVDEHLDFQITIDDRKTDLTRMGHLRGTDCCIIKSLMSDGFPQAIYKNADNLKDLRVWGQITPQNFQRLMTMFPNIVKLSLNQSSLLNGDLVRLEPHDELNNYWTQLRSLSVVVGESMRPEHIGSIFGLPVSGLERFSIRAHTMYSATDNFNRPELFLFVSRMVNLKELQLQCTRVVPDMANPPNPVVNFNFEGIQLKSVRLSLSSRALRNWMRILRGQNELRRIQIVDFSHHDVDNVYPMIELRDTLTRNQNTLTTIEFVNITLSQPVDCLVFEGMRNLKRLVLRRHPILPGPLVPTVLAPHIQNLQWLPNTSLESIALDFLCCDTNDLCLMADRMINIKRIELKNVGITGTDQAGDRFGVNPQVLQKIAMIGSCEYVVIDPLPIDRFDILYNNSRGYVVVNGITIDVLENYNRSMYIAFNFRNARNQL